MPSDPHNPEFEIEGLSETTGDGSLDGPMDDPEESEDDENSDAQSAADPPSEDELRMDKIRQGTKAIRWFPWPGAPQKRVAIRALSRLETYQGAASALQALEDVGLNKDDVFQEITLPNGMKEQVRWLDLAQRDEWLCLALRRGDDPNKPLFTTSNDMRRKLTSQEIGKLYEVLSDHMAQTVPLTVAEQLANKEAWLEIVQTLKKKPEEILLGALPPAMLRELVNFLVEKYVT